MLQPEVVRQLLAMADEFAVRLDQLRALPRHEQPPAMELATAQAQAWLRRLAEGRRVSVADIDTLIAELEAARDWRQRQLGFDEIADERTRWLRTLRLARAQLEEPPAPARRVFVMTSTPRPKGLRARRRALHLTQGELAAKIPVTMRAVQLWEAGRKHPNRDHRCRLAEILGGDPSDYDGGQP